MFYRPVEMDLVDQHVEDVREAIKTGGNRVTIGDTFDVALSVLLRYGPTIFRNGFDVVNEKNQFGKDIYFAVRS